MKIIAISDLHGLLPEITERADVMFLCGDISPLNIQFNIPEMTIWMYKQFIPWIKTLNVEQVYLIAGNHDAWFQRLSTPQRHELYYNGQGKLVYLKNESASYIDNNGKEWTIFGTPYCHLFGNWPFMVSDEVLVEKFANIPNDVDFILSHDTPYGVGTQDYILEKLRHGNHELVHVGNSPLRDRLESINYKWLFHGHIHSSGHTPEEFVTGKVVNVSLVDESYDLVYKPFILTIEEDGTEIY